MKLLLPGSVAQVFFELHKSLITIIPVNDVTLSRSDTTLHRVDMISLPTLKKLQLSLTNNNTMKHTLKILFLAAGLLVVQACGSKKSNESNAEATAIKKIPALSAADKRAKFEKQRADRAERRRIEYERLCATTPSYTDAKGKFRWDSAPGDIVTFRVSCRGYRKIDEVALQSDKLPQNLKMERGYE